MEPKRIVLAAPGRPSEYTVTVERLPLPVFYNDHSVKCTCLDCVVRRYEARTALQRSRGMYVK